MKHTNRLERLSGAIVCPKCRKALSKESDTFVCSANHGPYPYKSGIPFLIHKMFYRSQEQEHREGINWLKSFLKQSPRLYYGIWQIFCPVLMAQNGPKKIFSFLPAAPLIADIGSGPHRWHPDCINLDVYPFPEVDIVADAAYLPFADNTFDAVVSESLLEHVADPVAVANEIWRIAKPGGIIYVSAPFLTPYHASPDDFTRWTVSGLKKLFPSSEIVSAGVRSGPWSALLVFLAYWLGVIAALGSQKRAPFFAFVFMLILGPLKILDFIFSRFPGAEAVSAQLYIMGKKTPHSANVS